MIFDLILKMEMIAAFSPVQLQQFKRCVAVTAASS